MWHMGTARQRILRQLERSSRREDDRVYPVLRLSRWVSTKPGQDHPAADFVKGAKRKEKNLMLVPKGCAVQFADRTPLAVCGFEKEQKGLRVAYTSNRYLFEDVGLSDTAMKECIEMGADWKAVPRDSKEWRAAKLEHSRRKLQKLGDKLATPDPAGE